MGAPFVCQAVIAAGVPWHLFYFGSLLLSATNIILLTFTFRPTPNEFLRDKEVATVASKLNRTTSCSDSSVKDSEQESIKKERSSAYPLFSLGPLKLRHFYPSLAQPWFGL